MASVMPVPGFTAPRSPLDAADDRILGPRYGRLSWAILIATSVQAYDFLSTAAILPQIGDDLGRVGLLPWVLTVFPLFSAVAVLAAGPVIDNLGVRAVFRVSMITVVVASAGSALAPSVITLVATRAVSGLSSGMMMASSLSLIGLAYPARIVPKAVAFQSYAWGAMGIVAPGLAAVLTRWTSWRVVFLVAVPFGLMVMRLAWHRVPVTATRQRDEPFDVRGLVLVGTATVLTLMAVQRLDRISLPLSVAAFALGSWYWIHSGSRHHAVVQRRHVAALPFAALAATMALGFGSALSVDAYLPLYVRGGRGASVSVAAFTVVFLGTGWAIAAYGVGRWMDRFGATRVIVAGSVVVTGSLPVGAFLVFTESSLWMLYALMTILGFGVGFLTTAGRSLVQRISDAAEIGRANSSNQFVRMLGLSCGTALAGGVLLFVVNHRHGGVAEVQDLLSGDHHVTSAGLAEAVSVGYGWAFILASMLGAVGLLFAVVLHRTLNVGSAEASTG